MRPNEGREEEAKEASPSMVPGGMTGAKPSDDASNAALASVRSELDSRLKWSTGAKASVTSYTSQVVRTDSV